MDEAILKPVPFCDLRGWDSEDHLAAFRAFLPGAERMQEVCYKTRSLGVDGQNLAKVAALALRDMPASKSEAKQFFETCFSPHHVEPLGGEAGFVTGFFEPLIEASLTKTEEFCHPLYNRPPELIDLNNDNRPVGLDESYRFGQIVDGEVQPYLDRAEIQTGALEGRELELAWLADPVDVFFIHVQGSAKLQLQDGSYLRVTYAAKAGHPYTSVAKVLCHQTGTPSEQMTADKLADWMRANLDRLDDLLAHNRSYIFFKKVEGLNIDEGPIAAAKVPLVAGRSLAVDRTLHTFGAPIWLETEQPLPEDEKPLQRLMIAHDTGSAIVGPARGDVFTGTGLDAGRIAGRIRHDAQMTVFVPNKMPS